VHSGDLDNELSRVEAAGGRVLQKKTLITKEIGYMAVLLDTEGNRVALHSRR
jgi:predicted enzyme related to lactoylglutathione lyase